MTKQSERPKDSTECSDFKARLDRAVRDGARPTLGAESRPEEIEAHFRKHDLLPSRSARHEPVRAEVIKITEAEIRWFIVNTKPQSERVASAAFTDHGLKCCAPEIAHWAVSHRQDVVRVRPLFPRYVFVGLTPDGRGDVDFRTPRLCDGVSCFVREAGDLAEIEDIVIGDVMIACERRWTDFIWSKAALERPKRKQYRTEGFAHSMTDILEADPMQRMKLFIERFGRCKKPLQEKSN